MPGRRPAGAVERFISPIRDALSCVIRQPSLHSRDGYSPEQNPHALVLNRGEPVKLYRANVWLSVNQVYDIVEAEGERGPYKVSTRSYIYALSDGDGEIVGFHYHPESNMDFCHLHFRRSAEFGKAHFPTGRVAIEEVIALAIRDLGVTPRRADYREVLGEGLAAFRQWRTWDSRGTM